MPDPKTEWTQLEPGFGNLPFGDEDNTEAGIKIHLRGFGNELTTWTDAD